MGAVLQAPRRPAWVPRTDKALTLARAGAGQPTTTVRLPSVEFLPVVRMQRVAEGGPMVWRAGGAAGAAGVPGGDAHAGPGAARHGRGDAPVRPGNGRRHRGGLPARVRLQLCQSTPVCVLFRDRLGSKHGSLCMPVMGP